MDYRNIIASQVNDRWYTLRCLSRNHGAATGFNQTANGEHVFICRSCSTRIYIAIREQPTMPGLYRRLFGREPPPKQPWRQSVRTYAYVTNQAALRRPLRHIYVTDLTLPRCLHVQVHLHGHVQVRTHVNVHVCYSNCVIGINLWSRKSSTTDEPAAACNPWMSCVSMKHHTRSKTLVSTHAGSTNRN